MAVTKKALRAQNKPVSVELRMYRTGMVTHSRVDIRLKASEAQACRDLMDGFELDGIKCRNPGEVFRAMLRKYAEAQAAQEV